MSKVLTIFILLSVILGFSLFVIIPKYQNTMLFKNQVFNRKAQLAIKEEYVVQLQEASENLEKYPDQISKVEQALPYDPNYSFFLEFLQERASEYGLIFEESVFFEKSTSKYTVDVRESRIGVRVSGKYESFLNLIAEIEKLSRMAQISFISFSEPKDQDQTGIFAFELNIKLPYWETYEN